MEYFFSRVDDNNVFISSRVGDEFSTWSKNELKGVTPPTVVDNTYYQWNGSDWVALSEYPKQKQMPETIPQSITPRQIRLQLSAIGMRQAVEDYVASASLEIKDWWEFSLAYERNAPLLVEAATTLGMTSEQLDQFFIEADKL
jgi:hypothetical protein